MKEIAILILRHYEDANEFIQSDPPAEDVVAYLMENDMNTGLCNYIKRRYPDFEQELLEFLQLKVDTLDEYIWRIPQKNWSLANICLYDRINYLKQFV